MKEQNYITIQGWMRTELKLTGNELLAYALIYGFSQDRESTFRGSLSYVAEWLGCSKPTAIATLRKLVEKGMIERIEEHINGILFVRYRVLTSGKETLLGELKNFTTSSKETLPNKDNNNINDNNKKKEIKKDDVITIDYEVEIENEIKAFTNNEKLADALHEFVEYRIRKRQKMTIKAFKMMLKKLEGFMDDEKIDALETSMISNWTGVFPKHSYKSNEPAQRKDYSDIKKEDLEKPWDWGV